MSTSEENDTIASAGESGVNKSDEVVIEAVFAIALEGEDEDALALLQEALSATTVAMVEDKREATIAKKKV